MTSYVIAAEKVTDYLISEIRDMGYIENRYWNDPKKVYFFVQYDSEWYQKYGYINNIGIGTEVETTDELLQLLKLTRL